MRWEKWCEIRTELIWILCAKNRWLSSFDYEVLLRIVRTGLRGMGWWQRCRILFQTETLCFLQGLCSSVQIWAKAFPNGSPVTLQQAHAPRPCSPQGARWRQQGRSDLVPKEWPPPWKFGSFLCLIKQGCITLNICLLVRTYSDVFIWHQYFNICAHFHDYILLNSESK